MKDFKEIAEKCLAGELSGIFILQDGSEVRSNYLRKLPPTTSAICSYGLYGWYISDNGNAYGDTGYLYNSSIKKFISDNMKEQIKIDIPEGKVPVMEQTEKGVVITWKEKELTYKDIENKIILKNTHDCIIGYTQVIEDIKTFNCLHSDFYKKVEVLRKLTNIRNYFGKPNSYDRGYCVSHSSSTNTFYVGNVNTIGIWPKDIIFAKKEHAEQAIKMLGDELKYLFEPW